MPLPVFMLKSIPTALISREDKEKYNDDDKEKYNDKEKHNDKDYIFFSLPREGAWRRERKNGPP